MLLPGEKKLADELLNLVKTARDQEATIPEQRKILQKMGKLYLKDAIETVNGEQLVKASALINAALVRTENPKTRRRLKEQLINIYKGLLKIITGETLKLSYEELEQRTNDNKDRLHEIRVEIDEGCKKLKQYLNSYSLLNRNILGPKIIKETEEVSLAVQTKMTMFITKLWTQATDMCFVHPPCKYAVIGLGSLARQETTPYSDLEFALLIETESEEIKEYFKNLVHLFHLLILDLGETPVPTLAIESLNDFLTQNKDRFLDLITPCGFRLDGAMPWACKTPIGRKQTPQREALDLIKTPEEMAALLEEDNVLGQTYHVAEILCNSIFICGSEDIFHRYKDLSNAISSKTNNREKAKKSFSKDFYQSPDWYVIFLGVSSNLKIKRSFYRFPSSFVENLRIYFAPDYQPNSSWKVLRYLLKENIISPDGEMELSVLLAITYGVRLLTYFSNRGQYENFAFMKNRDYIFNKLRIRNPLKQRSDCRVAFFSNAEIADVMGVGCNGLRHVVKTYFLVEGMEVDHLRGEIFVDFEYCLISSARIWFRFRSIIQNLTWARSSNEVPSRGCGKTCGVNTLLDVSYISEEDTPALLKGVDKLIDHTGCKCLSLLNTSLCVSKAILKQGHMSLENTTMTTTIMELQELYRQKRYHNVRERFYLLLDLMDCGHCISDKESMMPVTIMIEKFFDEIFTFEESQQIIVNHVKSSLIERLVGLYSLTKQFEKGIQLCQEQIYQEEKESGLKADMPSLGLWYMLLGLAKCECGLYEEGLYCTRKAFDIHFNSHEDMFITRPHFTVDKIQAKKHHFKVIRVLALGAAQLYSDDERLDEAIEVLTKALTKYGKSFDIETNIDARALAFLCVSLYRKECEVQSGKYSYKANQYLQELLVVIAESPGQLVDNDTSILLVDCICFWIKYLAEKGLDNSYIIENIWSQTHQRNRSAPEANPIIIESLIQTVNDGRLQQVFHFSHKGDPDAFQKLWLGFFFDTCCYFEPPCWSFNSGPSVLKLRKAILQQVEIFCETDVKKMIPKSIYRMCLIYVDFKRMSVELLYALTKNKPEHIQVALALSVKMRVDLQKHFPTCHKAFQLTDINELLVILRNWLKDRKSEIRPSPLWSVYQMLQKFL